MCLILSGKRRTRWVPRALGIMVRKRVCYQREGDGDALVP